MNPSTRRYLPVVAVVALLLVAVYYGQPDRMTGSAAGAGCAAGEGQLVAENELGSVESGHMDAVRAVATFDTDAFDAGDSESLEDLKSAVEDLGGAALPALLEELNVYGCGPANAASVIDLVEFMGDLPEFDNEDRAVLVQALLDLAVVGFDAGDDKQAPTIGTGIEAGDDSKVERDVVMVNPLQERQFECAGRSLDLVQGWAASTKADLEVVLDKTEQLLAALDDGDPTAAELVELLAELAPEDEEWAKIFEQMAGDSGLHKDAQGTACDAAVQRGSELSSLRDDINSITSASVSVCLVEASIEWEDSSYADWALKNNEETVRLAAISAFADVGDVEDVASLLAHLFSVNDPSGISASESERYATIATIAGLVKDSDIDPAELLGVAFDLATAMGPDGQDWLAQLDQGVPDWEAEATEK
jgi:hypothetical protein